MTVGKSENLNRKVVLTVAAGLAGYGEHKLVKRLEQASPYGEYKILEVLTIIEKSPGLSAAAHRIVAMAKKVITTGDDELFQKLREHTWDAAGMGPMPADKHSNQGEGAKMKRMSDVRASGMLPQEFFEKEAREHLVEGDLFSYKNPVIPIMTKGRAYGSLSQKVVAQGIKLPELPLCNTTFQDGYIFLALWDDNSTYDDDTMYDCGAACLGDGRNAASSTRSSCPFWAEREARSTSGSWSGRSSSTPKAWTNMGFYYPEKHIFVTDKIVT